MKLELISFNICPFAQRAAITLLHKKIPFTLTYIDLANPPEWFSSVSPFGRVPVLKVDRSSVVFDSAIIDEFLEEICPGELLPKDPLCRALDRSIIDVGSNMLSDFSGIIHATDKAKFDTSFSKLASAFRWVNTQVLAAPYFNGEHLSLVDIAFAPLFMRMKLLGLNESLLSDSETETLLKWSGHLLEMPEIGESVIDNFEEIIKNHIRKKAPYAAERLGFA